METQTRVCDEAELAVGRSEALAGLAERLGVRHVGIIMDGNGRWAVQQGLPRLAGHDAGADAVDRVVEAARQMGLRALTLYAFSTENWQRPPGEVGGLMALLERSIRKQGDRLDRNGIRFNTIGAIERLPASLREALAALRERTAHHQAMTLSIALNYGGRDELVRAVRSLADEVAAGRLAPEAIDEAALAARLDTGHGAVLPDPDLIIRTAGEQRLSNFLLWQAAYSELYVTPKPWPEFDADDLVAALEAFAARERRFGRVPSRPR